MPPTPQAPKIEYRHNVAAARHEIGVKAGKVFVPFATISDAYYEQLAENSEQVAEAADEYEEEEG
jgi:hypothetical protein